MSVNKVILLGFLGKDPEVKYTQNGNAIANFSLATNEQWKDKNGDKQSRTEWHYVTLFGKIGEIAGQYLKKGSQVYIEGKIQSQKYTGKDGVERTSYNIVGSELKMLGGGENQPAQQSDNTTPPEPPKRHEAKPVEPVVDVDDDIPF